MSKGLFDDVPMLNTERDQAWEKFIKRKDVKAMMKGKEAVSYTHLTLPTNVNV